MNAGPPSSAPYEDRGGLNWFLHSWAPLAHPVWLVLWCLATLAYLFVRRDRSGFDSTGFVSTGAPPAGPIPWTWALLFTGEAVAVGAVLATGILVQVRMFTTGISKTSPGAWLVWIAMLRQLFLIFVTGSGLPNQHAHEVWYAAISSLLFLVPIYFGPPLGEWQHRWVAVVAIQAAPLLVHVLLSIAFNSPAKTGPRAWFWLPDLLSAFVLLTEARRRSRPFGHDEFHRAGLVIYATQSVAVAVIMIAIGWLHAVTVE